MAQQPTLGRGDTGEWVGYLQQMLEYHGVGSGFDAGSYCEVTERAVSALQERHGLSATGRCDEGTWAALAVEPGAGSASSDEDAPPADIALSTQVEVAAPDEAHTLDHLDDLPGNARATS